MSKGSREFWILKENIIDGNAVISSPEKDYLDLFVHTIEHSAYTEALAQIEKLQQELKLQDELSKPVYSRRKLEAELTKLREENRELVEALKKIANEDFRGNRPQSAVLAYETLKALVPKT